MSFKPGVAAALFAAALFGCTVVDQYADRAVVYNLEAEDALVEGLLLNVVRASDQRPMQFTSVQTISGVAAASGTAGLTSVPFGAHLTTSNIGMVSGTVSGGPTFTVPVLDTQEFYSGVLSPVQGNLFDFFIHEEFAREEIFSLFVETIAIAKDSPECNGPRSHTLDCELVFVNSPDYDIDFDLFQTLLDHLINLGLTTEPVAKGNGQVSASGCSTGSGSSSSGGGGTSSSSSSPAGQCQSSSPQYRFCFSPRQPEMLAYVLDGARCKSAALALSERAAKSVTTTTKITTKNGNDVTKEVTTVSSGANSESGATGQIEKKTNLGRIVLSVDFIQRLKEVAHYAMTVDPNPEESEHEYTEFTKHLGGFAGKKIVFSVYTRSTEGILYYLGRIVNHQLHSPWTYQIKYENSFVDRELSEGPCNPADTINTCKNFFVVRQGMGPSSLAVSYKGRRFFVPQNEEEQGDTLHVLSIVKQLLAINTSAKSLPQTNVLSVISP